MARFGNIEFDDRITEALRGDSLVVFAGAGVSIGAPSNLPSFAKLVADVAVGTGLSPGKDEPSDRFLGRLHYRKVEVHARAAQCLTPAGSAPNGLHLDLLRLFGDIKRVKLVTTNFDQHFETAAQTVYGAVPDIFRAPALPLGGSFRGIVHIHGAVTHPNEIVLTDADFGRAYLTEGWARRFLVDLFRSNTVLFVGYSHTDVVMTYLARALPTDGAPRFALTEEDGSWDLLGIRPIHFATVQDPNAYKDLYHGIGRLAERSTRGALDWQSRIAEIGRTPPGDEEAVGEIEQVLREVHTTRFLTDVARDSQWPGWLSRRKHLEALFAEGRLNERDQLLASWLAEHFAIDHADELFEIIAAHNLRLNPIFWWFLVRELNPDRPKQLTQRALKRWISILLASAPLDADRHGLSWLAERCGKEGAVDLALRVFLFMGSGRLSIRPGTPREDDTGAEQRGELIADRPELADHWTLNEVWTEQLKPHLGIVARPLLSGVMREFEAAHLELASWDRASADFDPASYHRAAIEPHEQDEHPKAIDVLINSARDALEWLAGHDIPALDAHVEALITSKAPLLRRLAIHAVTAHPRKTDEQRLQWLLDRVGLHDRSEHHEIYRAAAAAYPHAGQPLRRAVIAAIRAATLPADGDWSAEKRTARLHFDWLTWLEKVAPDCELLRAALDPIKKSYAEWQPSDHPELTHWSRSWSGAQSPWAVDDLLAKEPVDHLDDLLQFKGDAFEGPDRYGLSSAVREAAKKRPAWGFALMDALTDRSIWNSDLWPPVIRGVADTNSSEDDWRRLLAAIGRREIVGNNVHDVADVLYALVKDGGKPFALALLEQAEAIAPTVWELADDRADDEVSDWLSRAINRASGVVVEFWLNAMSLMMHGKSGDERSIPPRYKGWLTNVVQDPTAKGGYGRSVLASQLAFVSGLDEAWARTFITPMLTSTDRTVFAQAWDGFLVWGRLAHSLDDVLIPAFLSGLGRLDEFGERREKFVEFVAALALFHVDDPTQQLLPQFFRHASLDDRTTFAGQIGYFLRQIQPERKRQLWDRWLARYWQDRLQAVPAALEDAEIKQMLDWLPDLGDAYPEAVLIALRGRAVRIEHSHLLSALEDSDLATGYPAETAELLIYLGGCVVGYHIRSLATVAARLAELAPDHRRRLDEMLARIGAQPHAV